MVKTEPTKIAMPTGRPGRKMIYPWRTMSVGESFAVPIGRKVQRQSGTSMAGVASRVHAPRQFRARFIDGKKPVVRIWRVL